MLALLYSLEFESKLSDTQRAISQQANWVVSKGTSSLLLEGDLNEILNSDTIYVKEIMLCPYLVIS